MATTYKAFHDDARNAIREANAAASQTGIPQVVGYVKGFGWTYYDPRHVGPYRRARIVVLRVRQGPVASFGERLRCSLERSRKRRLNPMKPGHQPDVRATWSSPKARPRTRRSDHHEERQTGGTDVRI
jgi:hypothetical protein